MELKLSLPDQLAEQAKAAGLLTSEAIERRKQLDSFFSTVERLRAAGIPPISEEEIQAEIDAVRAARRSAPNRGA
jgi:hypothetical protein